MLNSKTFKSIPLLLLAAVLIFSSCGKENLDPLTTDDLLELQPENAPASTAEVATVEADVQARASRFLVGYVQVFNGAWVPFPGVGVSIVGTGCSESTTSTNSRPTNYRLPGICSGQLCMGYRTPARNGGNVLDIAIVEDHILGITRFTEAYQFLAADVNRDGLINSDDMTIMADVDLEILSSFPTSQNILFIDESDYLGLQATIDATGTVSQVELQILGSLGPCLDTRFVSRRAIKTGDLNGDFAF